MVPRHSAYATVSITILNKALYIIDKFLVYALHNITSCYAECRGIVSTALPTYNVEYNRIASLPR
jgi:hypothetical protein